MSFEAQLPELERLFCDSSLPNSAVLRSHALEVLLGFSGDDECVSALRKRTGLLRTVIAETAGPTALKALLLLVNLSADPETTEVLQSLGAVAVLVRSVLNGMKQVAAAHLEVTQSLLEEAEIAADSEREVKHFALSSASVPMESKQLVLEVEAVRLALLGLTNLTALSNQARRDLAQKGSVYEANSLLLFLDWLAVPRTARLFSALPGILLSLSADEETQPVLLAHCLPKILTVFGQKAASQELFAATELVKLLRNLSFHSDAGRLAEALAAGEFSKYAVLLLDKESPDVLTFGRLFVDILLALVTSDAAGEHPEKFAALAGGPGVAAAVDRLIKWETTASLRDRAEALAHALTAAGYK